MRPRAAVVAMSLVIPLLLAGPLAVTVPPSNDRGAGAPVSSSDVARGPPAREAANRTVAGPTAAIAVAIAPISGAPEVAPLRLLTFTETGLPSGTTWEVVVAGSIERASTPAIVFWESPGEYAYSVPDVAGLVPDPGAGTASLLLENATFAIAFQPTYPIEFDEFGLPATIWSIVVAANVTESLTPSLFLALANGTYDYSVPPAADGYFALPANGSVIVSGLPLVLEVDFFPPVSPGPSITSFVVTPSSASLGTAFRFSVDADGTTPLTYVYGGLPPGCGGSDASTFVCTPTSAGEYIVTVRVVDTANLTASDFLTLVVTNATAASVAPAASSPSSVLPALISLAGYLAIGATALVFGGLLVWRWPKGAYAPESSSEEPEEPPVWELAGRSSGAARLAGARVIG